MVFTTMLCFTTTMYFFSKPEGIDPESGFKLRSKTGGFWGPFDAEFNWCEPDYETSPLVAEPLNTLTSGLYLAPPLLGFGLMPELLCIETRFVVVAIWIFLIGVGSIIFHGTLRYWGQLCDELPMYGLILTAAYTGWYRHGAVPSGARVSAVCSSLMWTILTLILFLTEQTATVHQVARGVMSVTFAVGFAFILTAGSRAAGEAQEKIGPSRPGVMGVFAIAFWAFVFAIAAWAADNTMCAWLHALPFNIPYPQLHALVWHVGTAIGLWCMVVTLLFHRTVELGVGVPRVRWFVGVVPYLVAAAD